MASTVTQLITKFTQGGFYPDCDATTAESIFNDCYRELLLSLELRTNVITIPITAGTATYDISENVIRILEAYYEEGADPSDLMPLEQKSLREMQLIHPHFRAANNAKPHIIYTTSTIDTDSGKKQIGLYPPPSDSTSGTYPRLKLYITQQATLSGSETLPTGLLSDDVLLYMMAKKWAIRQDPERAAYWSQLANLELARNQDHVKKLLQDAPLAVQVNTWVRRQSKRP